MFLLIQSSIKETQLTGSLVVDGVMRNTTSSDSRKYKRRKETDDVINYISTVISTQDISAA